jgi:hypothetical protein
LFLHSPQVKDIAQQVNGVGFGLIEEVQQIGGLTVFIS